MSTLYIFCAREIKVLHPAESPDMARPYLDDLRRELLEAFDQGKGSLSELAEDFVVSLGWAWKVSPTRKRTGRMDRTSYRHGDKRRIDESALSGICVPSPTRL